MDGFGTFVWKNGDQFKGNFSEGKEHGYGELTFRNGRMIKGIWKKGKLRKI